MDETVREIDRRAHFLGKRLESAEVVDPAAQTNRGQVFFGATVTYLNQRDGERQVTILGPDEADISRGEVSLHAPIARALLRTQIGDTVRLQTPSGWDELEVLPSALGALGERPAGSSVIGVTHAPYQRVLNRFVELGADAVFGGHTHGGQVCLPGYGALVANCDIPLKQAKGLSTWTRDGRTVPLNVSAGCGHSIYAPARFACRPEATLLTLTARTT